MTSNDEVIVRDRNRHFGPEDRYFAVNDNVLAFFEAAAVSIRKSNSNFAELDYRVFIKLWAFVPLSQCREELMRDETSGEFVRDTNENGVLNRLVAVGCRVVHSGIANLANSIGVSTSKLEKQLRLYREIGLVVNEANAISKRPGFIEFDALVGWRGKAEHREAYLAVQRSSEPILLPGWQFPKHVQLDDNPSLCFNSVVRL